MENSRLFKSPVLERMTHTNIAVPIVLFCVYAVVLLTINFMHTTLSPAVSFFTFLLGWFSFTWVEYIVHRYVFHIPVTSAFKRRFQYIVHGVHHAHPKDKDRLAMPPILSVALATTLLILFKLTIGDYVFTFLPGFLVGYASYLLIHYLVHAYPPPKNGFKYFWINHSIHHHRDSSVAFGVTTTLWDHLYRTHYNKLLTRRS